MAIRVSSITLVLVSIFGLLSVGCDNGSPDANRGGSGNVRIDGSSTVFPLTEAAAAEYRKATRGRVNVSVGVSGTGGGFKRFIRGETDIQNASRPILEGEIELARQAGMSFIEIPIAFDALTVVVHPDNDWVDHLTVEELRRIWEPAAANTITNWSQVRPGFPDRPLVLFGAGTDSGTFDYFTEAIVGQAKSSRGDFTASEDDNVLVRGIAGNVNSLGFFGYSYYAENRSRVRSVPIVNPKTGRPVAPSDETVMNGTYVPLSRPLFLYVNAESLKRSEVREFVDFYLNNAPEIAAVARMAPLTESAYRTALRRVAEGQVGTAFGGHSETGLTADDLFNRPLQ